MRLNQIDELSLFLGVCECRGSRQSWDQHFHAILDHLVTPSSTLDTWVPSGRAEKTELLHLILRAGFSSPLIPEPRCHSGVLQQSWKVNSSSDIQFSPSKWILCTIHWPRYLPLHSVSGPGRILMHSHTAKTTLKIALFTRGHFLQVQQLCLTKAEGKGWDNSQISVRAPWESIFSFPSARRCPGKGSIPGKLRSCSQIWLNCRGWMRDASMPKPSTVFLSTCSQVFSRGRGKTSICQC